MDYDTQEADVEDMDEENKKLFSEAIMRRDDSFSAEQEQREQVAQDILFALREDSQWDDYDRRQRKDRPRYTINRVRGAIQQVIGDMRQNRIDIKVRPRNKEASEDMADVLNGLIRSIEKESNFDYVGDVAAKEAFTGGFGAWQVITQAQDEESFDNVQDIKIKAIHSACTSVWVDRASTDEFHRDARWIQVDEEISKEEHKERWPNAKMTSLGKIEGFDNQSFQDRDTIRIADYWCKKPYKKKIAQFNDGTRKELTPDLEMVLDELAEQGIHIQENEQGEQMIKTVDAHKVVHYKINGAQILEGPHDWAGSLIPVITLYGSQFWMEGNHYYSGLVRFAKDPQRFYNYAVSSAAEETAVAMNNKIAVTPQMMAGYEPYWEDPNPINVLPFNPDPRVPGGMPVRLGSAGINTALIEQTQRASNDVQVCLGVSLQTSGFNPGQQSGKALLAQKEQMNSGTFEMLDNFARAKAFTGEIVIDLIPHIMDTERMERILTEEDETKLVTINQTIYDAQTGRKVKVENDISMGKYDVISDVGPSYKTQRQETQEKMAFLVQTSPDLAGMAVPIMLENDTSPTARKMGEAMLMDLVRQGRIEPNEKQAAKLKAEQEAKAAQGPTPEEQAMQLQIEKLKNENLKLAAEARKAGVEAFTLEAGLETQPAQEMLENAKLESEVQKNRAQSAKLVRDSNEPYRTNTGGQK